MVALELHDQELQVNFSCHAFAETYSGLSVTTGTRYSNRPQFRIRRV